MRPTVQVRKGRILIWLKKLYCVYYVLLKCIEEWLPSGTETFAVFDLCAEMYYSACGVGHFVPKYDSIVMRIESRTCFLCFYY